jgi:GNAT superfamily N-acetyltransferase
MPPTAPGRKRALKAVVEAGGTPGLIAYSGDTPVGWISLGPREDYARLQTSFIMKPVDDAPVWSIVCFFVDPRFRGQGVCEALLAAGVRYARSRGARLIEGYPVDRAGRSSPDAMWFGPKAMFDRAGFQEVARRKSTRPVVRRALRS